MFRSFSKGCLSALLALVSLSTINSSLIAWESWDACNSNRVYVGAFGGGIYSGSTSASQMGTAFFPEATGGPLAVLAQGKTKKTSSGFGGLQIGYEWAQNPLNMGCSRWSIIPAAELEAYWYSRTAKGHLINPTDRLPEHDFFDSFHMDAGVYLANIQFSLNHSSFEAFSPYISGGIGVTRISIRKATSTQISPDEAGINHFNSKRNDDSWAFGAQAKAGLRYKISESFHIFGEYRYLYVDSSNYIFGSTVYSTHVPTSPWNVKVKNTHYNAFTVGIQYDL